MKSERDFVESIQEAIRAEPALKGAVVFKHAETLTAGIPDMSVTHFGTSWLEVKFLRAGKHLKDIIERLQIVTCHQLAEQCNGRCWIAVYEELPRAIPRSPKKECLTLWAPRALYNHLYGPFLIMPVRIPSLASMVQAINTHGAVRFEGHPHEQIARLFLESETL